MDSSDLRNLLITSLVKMYEMNVFRNLAVFLQGEVQVLFYLLQNPDRIINPSELSEKLHVSRSRITATLRSLRKKKYIAMELCWDDRRRMQVTLTPVGLDFIRVQQRQVERYFDLLVEGLKEDNVMELNRLIELSMWVMEAKDPDLKK